MTLLVILGAVVIGCTVAAILADVGWPIELFSHFRPHLFLAALALAVLVAIEGRLPVAGVLAVAAAANGLTFRKSAHVVPQRGRADEPGLTIVWANVLKRAAAAEKAVAFARASDADVLILGEAPAIDREAFARLTADWPHLVDPGSDGPAGPYESRVVAVSKRPLHGVRLPPDPLAAPRAILSFSVVDAGRAINVVAVHASPPKSGLDAERRDAQFVAVAAEARAPFVLVGDFNATPWSPAMRRLLPGTRVGAPLRASTWLTGFPLIGLPIDHILISEEIAPLVYKVGPFIGSDHRPILAKVTLEKAA